MLLNKVDKSVVSVEWFCKFEVKVMEMLSEDFCKFICVCVYYMILVICENVKMFSIVVVMKMGL